MLINSLLCSPVKFRILSKRRNCNLEHPFLIGSRFPQALKSRRLIVGKSEKNLSKNLILSQAIFMTNKLLLAFSKCIINFLAPGGVIKLKRDDDVNIIAFIVFLDMS